LSRPSRYPVRRRGPQRRSRPLNPRMRRAVVEWMNVRSCNLRAETRGPCRKRVSSCRPSADGSIPPQLFARRDAHSQRGPHPRDRSTHASFPQAVARVWPIRRKKLARKLNRIFLRKRSGDHLSEELFLTTEGTVRQLVTTGFRLKIVVTNPLMKAHLLSTAPASAASEVGDAGRAGPDVAQLESRSRSLLLTLVKRRHCAERNQRAHECSEQGRLHWG
jgi:hypothetical protein